MRNNKKYNRGGYAIGTIRRWELDRITELYCNVWLLDFIDKWHDPGNLWIPKCMLMHL